MTMITPSYLGETIEYSSLHACRSTLEDPTALTCVLTVERVTGIEPALSAWESVRLRLLLGLTCGARCP